MRTQTRLVLQVVIALALAVSLTGCYRSLEGSLEPTPNGVSQASVNTPIPMPSFTPVEAATETPQEPQDIAPTPEEMTPLASPLPASITPRPRPTTAVPADGQGGPVVQPQVTQATQVVAIAPSFTPQPPSQTPVPTQPPSATPVPATPTTGPTATITSVYYNPLPPTPTYTPFMPPAGQQPAQQEGVPLAERPTDTAVPIDQSGQGGFVPTNTPQEVAQAATLTTNQMTATAIIFQATAAAAATQGTQLAPPAQPGQVQPAQPTPIPQGQQVIIVTSAPAGQCNTHLISPGETLSRIALTYGVTTQQIAQANNITNPDLILAGSTLIIPCPLPVTPTPIATVNTSGQGGQANPTGPTGQPFTYIVEPGDNLYRLSLRFNVSMAALMQANGLTPATINQIYAGQQLYIPAAQGVIAVTATPQGQPAPIIITATPQGQALPAG